MYYKVRANSVDCILEYDQQINNMLNKPNLWKIIIQKIFIRSLLLEPAILTTDARMIFEADVPSESNIFCLDIQTCDGNEMT